MAVFTEFGEQIETREASKVECSGKERMQRPNQGMVEYKEKDDR